VKRTKILDKISYFSDKTSAEAEANDFRKSISKFEEKLHFAMMAV